MTSSAAATLARALMNENGLTHQAGWEFTFDNARRRFGQCSMQFFFGGLKWGRISLSRPLTEVNEEERVRNTILHEIAHAKANLKAGRNVGHSAAWKREAVALGIKPERCYSEASTNTVPLKWKAVCEAGHEFQKARMTARAMQRLSSCGICSPTFSHAHLLKYQPNPEYRA